jgi:O-succinylbenzoate synthase
VIITAVELREIRLPLIHFFETSFGRTTERRILLVRVTDKNGAHGWGECTAGEGPYYCDEWAETAWPTIITFLAPMVVGKEIAGN